MPPITVVIAEGDKTSPSLSLNILQPEKGISVVGLARTRLEALIAVDKFKPSILLLHLNLIKGKRDKLLHHLQERSPRTKVILLTRRARENSILKALSNGARGYLKETAIETFLLKAVRQVEAGEAWVQRKMVAKIVDRLTQQNSL